jgi:hypothetical protein
MAKRSHGIFTLLTGMAAGAAALFFSEEKNRDTAKVELTKAKKSANKIKADYKKNPKAFTKKVKTKGKKLANKVIKEASTKTKKLKIASKIKKATSKSKAKPKAKAKKIAKKK